MAPLKGSNGHWDEVQITCSGRDVLRIRTAARHFLGMRSV